MASNEPEKRSNSRKGRPNKGERRDFEERFSLDMTPEAALDVLFGDDVAQ